MSLDSPRTMPLLGRSKLLQDLNEVLSTKQQNQALVVFNLHAFEKINYTYGYDHGDQILIEIAGFLTDFFSYIDGIKLYNVQERKFIALLDQDSLDEYLQSLMSRFLTPWVINGVEQFLTISFGVSYIANFDDTAEHYMSRTIQAAEEAREKGSNQIVITQSRSPEDQVRRMELENHMRSDISYNIESTFLVYYHPIVDASTGQIEGFEALSRWRNAELGFVFPDQFIPLAEEVGLIHYIDLHVLRQATKFVKQLHDQGNPVTISVNLSAAQLSDPQLVETICKVVDENALPYRYVNIEITESMAIENINDTIHKIGELKNLGFGVHLDDFGVGHSSLHTLKQLPVTTLKIDRSFIQQIHESKYDYTFVKAMIQLAHSAHIKVVCEGVETREDYVLLKALDCNYLQGFLFSKPMPEQDVSAIVARNFDSE